MTNANTPDHPPKLPPRDELFEAVDRWGPDLAEWRDRRLAHHGREALLADRRFRSYRDGATDLLSEFETAAAALDERIAASGALERIQKNVERATARKPTHWGRRVAAVAAMLLVSAALGGAFETQNSGGSSADMQVVQVDPLVFGMSGPDF